MSSTQKDSHRIISNTVILFTRLVLSTVIVLFSTRIVLKALGSSDYGIFSLISSMLIMLTFLNAALGSSTQRFLSYYHGIGDDGFLKKVFSNSLFLHIAIGILIVLFMEIVGFFLFRNILKIAPERIYAAKLIYQYTAIAFFFNIISVPFTGALNAHENQFFSAIVGLFEAFAKLGIAYYLLYTHGDKLIVYGLLMASIMVVKFIMFALFCFKKYTECTLKKLFKVEKTLIKELTSFAGWNLFGIMCSMGRTQGLQIILNRFYGTIANAAYGLSNQVGTQLNYFSESLLVAVNPQIMRAEGNGFRQKMLQLAMLASKYGGLIMAGFSIPILFELPSILHLWLDNVPPNTVAFCSLTILGIIINQETVGLQSAVQAIGKIKIYQITIGILLMLNLPLAYLLLSMGYAPYWSILIFVIIEAIACVFRLLFVRSLADLSIREYVQKVFVRQIVPVLFSAITCWLCISLIHNNLRWVFTIIISSLLYSLAVYFISMERQEKLMLTELLTNIKNKFLKPKS